MTDSLSDATDDVAAEPGPAEPEVKGLERRRSVFARPAVAWSVAAVCLALAVFAGMQWADLYAAEQERIEVREAARAAAGRLTTFEGADIENWYASALETATGAYGEQLRDVFDQATRDQLRSIEAVSRGEVENLFVQEVDGDKAKAFAVVTQTYANTSTADPVEDHLRLDMTLEKVDGEWLASDVAVLGPAGVVAPTGPTEPPAGGDQ